MTPPSFATTAARRVEIGRRFDARGWVLGTSGNFSAVLKRRPLRLAITPSGLAKGDLTADEILEVGPAGRRTRARQGRPSSEVLIHVAIVHQRGAGAVLYTHSIWSTILSDLHARDRGFAIEGYEMLKGLEGVTTHEHREWLGKASMCGSSPLAACSRSDCCSSIRRKEISRSSCAATAPRDLIFLSDVTRELDAERSAGLKTLLCVRPSNPAQPAGHGHGVIRSFDEIVD